MATLYGDALAGKTAVVTGANSGIGFETARVLAANDCRVIMCCRNAEAGKYAAEGIAEATGKALGQDIFLVTMDLANLTSVKEAAAEIGAVDPNIDFLVLNAGIMATPKGYTAQGFESQIGTNHFGHFYLTQQLLGGIKAHAARNNPSRIVVLSSTAHALGKFDFKDLHYTKGRRYNEVRRQIESFALAVSAISSEM